MYVSAIGIVADGISCYPANYSMHINLIKPTASYDGAMLNEKGMIPKVKGGLSNPWGPLGVSHVSPPYCSIVSWGHLLAGRENHHHAHACTHSPRRTFWVADGLPTRLIASLFTSSHAG